MYSSAENYVTSSLEKSKRILVKYLPAIILSPKKKDVHKIRVAIKKINATYGLIEFISPGKFNRKFHYGRIKDIFQCLGKIRELQLNDTFFKKCKLPPASEKLCEEFQKSEKNKARKKLKTALKDFNKDSLESSILFIKSLSRNLTPLLLKTKAKLFIHAETKGIKQLLKEYNSTLEIHEIRKILKSINYTAIFLSKLNPSPKIRSTIILLEDVSGILGTWHDRIKLIHFLDKLILESANKPNIIKPFTTIKNRLSQESLNTLTLLKPKLGNIILTLKSI